MSTVRGKYQMINGNKIHVRPGEVIGGGYFVVRRGEFGNRIKPSEKPYEHSSFASAQQEFLRLQAAHPGNKYCILQDCGPDYGL